MRIFVSSSFEDLKEHRAAAIRVLRQLGHEVLAMEDIIAASTAPLSKVIDMVDRSDAYVGIFAWRYGYIPGRPGTPSEPALVPPVAVAGADYGDTSITHYEYLRAVERKLPIMAFLLDEHCPWAPHLIDGFDTTRRDAPANANEIRALRLQLQQERVVSWFTTPTDLEARVSAAVTTAGLTAQLDLKPATALGPMAGVPGDSSAEQGIREAILAAGDWQRALKIDLATTWWSTRLYLIAALADRLTRARRILVVDSSPEAEAKSPPPPVAPRPVERFVGQLSTTAIRSTIGPKVGAIAVFEKWLEPRPVPFGDVENEVRDLLNGWRTAFGDPPGTHANEKLAKVDLTPELLRRWFDDWMLQQPVDIADLQKASVVDLLRLLDYPNDYVPVLTRHFDPQPPAPQQQASERVNVLDKTALNARLARSYLVELMDRARLK